MARDRYGYYSDEVEVRVGITERDVTREHLSWAFANEYISHEEFDQRSDLVNGARTQAALNRIVGDLPKFVPPPVPVPVKTRAKRVVQVVNGIHPSFKALAFLPLSASVALDSPIIMS